MKIRIMVVDDEPIAAEATALMASRADDDFEIAGICHSGREAVKKAAILNPDLVIMDIQMQGINGLDAMSRILKDSPGTQFIILSAYSEFSYAVEALNLGASDYLLKPVKQADLNASLQKTAADILVKKELMDQELKLQERLDIALPIIKKDFMRALMPDANAEEKLIACASFLSLNDRACFMAAVSCHGKKTEPQILVSVIERLSFHIKLVSDIIDSRLCIICAPVPEGLQQETYAAETTEQLETLMRKYKGGSGELFAGRSGIAKGITELRTALRQAMCAMDYAVKNSEAYRCVMFDEMRMRLSSFDNSAVPDNPARSLANSAGEIIERAVRYIKENHGRDLTLDEMASYMNLSPYYFSRFFKESTGFNFSEMLVQIRIDRAKELLAEPGTSVKDVAYSVGYNDPNYFSKVFHKATGIKASDYKFRDTGQ